MCRPKFHWTLPNRGEKFEIAEPDFHFRGVLWPTRYSTQGLQREKHRLSAQTSLPLTAGLRKIPPYKNGKYFLNPDEAAQVLRMDSRTLVRWARLGQVPAHPLGEGKRRLWRFIETELISWLEERGTPLKKPVANTMETAIGAHARRI